ncbi:MAG: hypothetical protein ACE5KA_04615 [Nitrososphaerales archaeon]
MNTSLVAYFEHYGVAPFEVEALFSILNSAFTVREREIERNYDNDYACMIDINFPLEFNDNFFETFGHRQWDKITFLIKEMRRRTGNKGVMLIMQFVGMPALSFIISMRHENLFEFALEKMEILNELVSMQTDSRKLPALIEKVQYDFDSNNFKWCPTTAWGNGTAYQYDDGEWVVSNQS